MSTIISGQGHIWIESSADVESFYIDGEKCPKCGRFIKRLKSGELAMHKVKSYGFYCEGGRHRQQERQKGD